MARELANWIVYGFSDTICAPLRKHIYCNVRGTIGRSSDFVRHVCRGLGGIKKREKKHKTIREVKKKRLNTQKTISRAAIRFFMTWRPEYCFVSPIQSHVDLYR